MPETSSESGEASDQEFHALILCFGFKILMFLIGFSDCCVGFLKPHATLLLGLELEA